MTVNAKWGVISLTLLLWAIGCCLYCYWYITSILAQPIGDTYANSEGFQFLMFMIGRFPFLLMGLFFMIYVEAIICDFLFGNKN